MKALMCDCVSISMHVAVTVLLHQRGTALQQHGESWGLYIGGFPGLFSIPKHLF